PMAFRYFLIGCLTSSGTRTLFLCIAGSSARSPSYACSGCEPARPSRMILRSSATVTLTEGNYSLVRMNMSQSGCHTLDFRASQKWREFGIAGLDSNLMPASSGVRLALRLLHGFQAVTQFCHEVPPPRELGMTWSMVMFSQFSLTPQNWHFQPSRLNSTFLRKRGGFHFLLTRFNSRIVAGTRMLVEGELKVSSHSEGLPSMPSM